MNIEFADLPPRTGRGVYVHHRPVADALRARPGQWARVAAYGTASTARHMAYIVRSGRLKAYAPAGAFEADWRPSGDAFAVWARFTGGEGV